MTSNSQRLAALGAIVLVILAVITLLNSDSWLRAVGIVFVATAFSVLYWVVPPRFGGRGGKRDKE